jgi:hypothetical protein
MMRSGSWVPSSSTQDNSSFEEDDDDEEQQESTPIKIEDMRKHFSKDLGVIDWFKAPRNATHVYSTEEGQNDVDPNDHWRWERWDFLNDTVHEWNGHGWDIYDSIESQAQDPEYLKFRVERPW